MSNMVTRCPKCATSFRITSAQLQSAKGAVRCGSCLHIFKAQDHLVSGGTAAPASSATKPGASPATKPTTAGTSAPRTATAKPTSKPVVRTSPHAEPTKASAAPTSATTAQPTSKPVEKSAAAQRPAPVRSAVATPAPQPTQSAEQKLMFDQEEINRELALSGDDDFLISDDMDEPDQPKQTDYEFDGFLDIENLPKQNASLFDREIRQKAPEKDDVDPDESWAMELLDEADDEMRMSSSRNNTEEQEEQAAIRLQEQSVNAYLDDGKEPDETAPSPTIPFKGPVFNIIAEKSDNADEETTEEIHPQAYRDNQLYEQALSDNKDESRLRAFDTSRAALLMNIMPEPVEMTTRRDRRLAAKRLWGGLSLLLIVVLFVQIAWMQFDNLNRTQPYRGFYESVCSVLGCQLPVLVDRSKIRAYNLVVRNHPRLENVLIVDAILLNNASFQQPFPELILAFSTIDDKPVASRRFKPQEYLRGELAGRNLMPQNQPVYLSLELVDPGSDAVNYHAYIPE